MKYTKEQEQLLIKMWSFSTTDELKRAFPERTKAALQQKAQSLGVKAVAQRRRKGDLNPLLDDSPLSYYWLGFILSDGHITKDGQLVVTIVDKDESHLAKLASYLSTKIKRPYHKVKDDYKPKQNKSLVRQTARSLRSVIRISVQDPESANKLRKKLGLTLSNKTYNSPKVSAWMNFTDLQLNCLLIGMLDADGRPQGAEIHSSWEPLLNFLKDRRIVTTISLSKYLRYYISLERQKELKNIIKEHDLPVLERKWFN